MKHISTITDEDIRFVSVGNDCALFQGDEDVCLARVDDVDVRTVALHIASEGQCHL